MRRPRTVLLLTATLTAATLVACGGSSRPEASPTTSTTAAASGATGAATGGRPAPYPFATDQRIGLGAWTLVVDRPSTSGSTWTVPVHLTNVSGRTERITPTELFGFQDGVSGTEVPVASVSGLTGTVATDATIDGVVTITTTGPVATPLLVVHTDRIGGVPAYVQLVGTPESAP